MEFKEIDFREYEKTWCKICNKEQVELLDEITKNKQKGDFYLGYVYIDHYHGLSIFLVGKGIQENDKISFVTKLDELTDYTFAMTNNIIESFDNFKIEKINEVFLESDTKDVIENFIYDEFYSEIAKKNPFIFEFRKDKMLDESRANGYPDSISFLLAKEGFEPELIWGRVEGFHKEDKEVRVVLLNDPYEKAYGLCKGDVCGLVKDLNKFDGYVAITGYKKNKKFKI